MFIDTKQNVKYTVYTIIYRPDVDISFSIKIYIQKIGLNIISSREDVKMEDDDDDDQYGKIYAKIGRHTYQDIHI